MNTLNSRKSSAELCRINGWGPGTILVGVECGLPEKIQITAVGRDEVLAICDHGREALWTLHCRDWKFVGTAKGGAT